MKKNKNALSGNLGAELKNLRIRSKLTQEQLGKKLGIDRKTISAIENEKAGTMNELSLNLISKWYSVCESKTPNSTQQSFIYSILRIFNM